MVGLEGKTLDHYELRKLIGRGGMADVYEGYDQYFRRVVAVKVFKREDDEMLRRFIREANLMASLSNEHLVPIYGSGESQVNGFTQYYIVMPFMEGGTLRALIRRSPLSLAEACECLHEIGEALDYIHSQGIIHRDIKASNVLLSGDGRYYLSDFGIARMTTGVTRLTSTGDVLGTVDYVAPELFEGNHKADALSDLYSLGVLLFEMVTGQLPFYAENQIAIVTMHVSKPPPSPRSLKPNVPPQVERVMLKALEKRPEQRYQSASELAEAFCRAVATGSKQNVQEGTLEPPAPVAPVNPVAPIFVRPAPVSTPVKISSAPPTPNVVTRGVRTSPVGRRPQGPRRPNPARQRTVIVTILALFALLVVAVPVIFATRNLRTSPATSNLTPVQTATLASGTQTQSSAVETPDLTATAQVQATATVQAQEQATATAVAGVTATAQAQEQATATAVAGVTATAQAQAIATAGVLQTVTAGTPTYQDSLTDATSQQTIAANWDQNGHCAFMPDGYHVTEGVNLVNLHGCRESAKTYSNAAITVDVRILSGHSGGLFFRVSVDTLGNYVGGYLFEVDSQGNYKISSFNRSPQVLRDWTASSALKTGNGATNTLQVVARGSTLLFYANGVLLTQLNDASYTSGMIAFLATTTDSNADIVYSNLKVYSLP
jgi:eukaryotic-like serine/threonine-protein kinase